MTQPTRKQLIEMLGQYVMECNKEGYKSYVEDLEPNEKQHPFTTYGVDTETVSMVLRDFNEEIATWLQNNQK